MVFYLDSAAFQETYGRCYQTLTFTFLKGSYEKHKKDIDAIMAEVVSRGLLVVTVFMRWLRRVGHPESPGLAAIQGDRPG